MKNIFYLMLYVIVLSASCKKDNKSDCDPPKDIYYKLDDFATSLINVYQPGDTLKLRQNSGTIFNFIAQQPDSGYAIGKEISNDECEGNNLYFGYYEIKLNPQVTSDFPIKIKVYYKSSYANTELFSLDFRSANYEVPAAFLPFPPDPFYIDSLTVNNRLYRYVQKISYADGYIYYNRTEGLLKINMPNGEYYEREP